MVLTVEVDATLEHRIAALPEADRQRFYNGLSFAVEEWLDDVQDEAVLRDYPEKFEGARPVEKVIAELGLDH